MIYYIVGIEPNHDETVLASYDTADRAAAQLEQYRTSIATEHMQFRIDTVPSNEEKRAANALIPPNPHKRTTDVLEPTGPDFSVSELFGKDPASKLETRGSVCRECGAIVAQLFDHTAWHNKLLP